MKTFHIKELEVKMLIYTHTHIDIYVCIHTHTHTYIYIGSIIRKYSISQLKFTFGLK